MKAIAPAILSVITFIASAFVGASAATIRQFNSTDVLARAEGVGSHPSVILRDGTVCAVGKAQPSRCTALMNVPNKIVDAIGKREGQFDGLFDLIGDGSPQIFVEYWPTSSSADCPKEYKDTEGGEMCDAVVLLVYLRIDNSYQLYLNLYADSFGYSPGAWFLSESPRKAIFETRCVGSSGSCLLYLNLSKRALEPIDGTVTLQQPPILKHFDHDHAIAFFVTDRGYDRNGAQGAALIHWTGHAYRQWWPNWYAPPYVMYAQMADIGGGSAKQIIAVLDPGKNPDRGSNGRELGIWKLNSGKWHMVAKTQLPSVGEVNLEVGYPTLDKITPQPHGALISLSNRDGSTFTCRYADHKLTCPLSAHAVK